MKKIYIISLLLVVLSGAAIALYSTFKSRDVFSENLIISISANLERELASYFDPVRQEFNKIIENFHSFSGNQMNDDSLSSIIIPVISGVPAIGSVMLYNSSGYIFNIHRDKNTYVSSLEKPGIEQGTLVWSRRMNDHSISSRWTEVLIGQENRLKVAQDILDMIASDDESVMWTGIYQSRQLKEPVLTAAVDWVSSIDSSIFICSFEMPVRLMVRHLNAFNKYKNRRVFLAMTSGQLIDFPTRVSDSVASFEELYKEGLVNTIQDSNLLSFINSWKKIGGETDMTFHQQFDGDDWWVHIRDFSNFERIAAVGLAMPEGSLKMGLVKSYSRIILVILFLMFSILFFFIANSKRKKPAPSVAPAHDSSSVPVTNPEPISISVPAAASPTGSTSDPGAILASDLSDWMALIARGENQSVEFKSALRMDMNLGKVNTGLENVIMKSVAAFSNGDGGILLMGVRDDGNILGIEGDLSTLKKQDSDYFEIHLRNLLKQQFGVIFITRNMEVHFPTLEGKEICAIIVKKGTEPVYVTAVDKNGNKSERFYVRSGNSSQEIESLKEINEYISKRF